MIAHLRGTVKMKNSKWVVLDVGGFGIKVFVPDSTLSTLKENEEIFLHTSFVVKQDSFEIFGFKNYQEKVFFEKVKSVSNVGPRIAFNAISELGIEGLKKSVLNNNPVALERVPGIGKKTATRVLVELKSKIDTSLETYEPAVQSKLEAAVNALVKLGYSKDEARKSVSELSVDDDLEVEDVVREALLNLGGFRDGK